MGTIDTRKYLAVELGDITKSGKYENNLYKKCYYAEKASIKNLLRLEESRKAILNSQSAILDCKLQVELFKLQFELGSGFIRNKIYGVGIAHFEDAIHTIRAHVTGFFKTAYDIDYSCKASIFDERLKDLRILIKTLTVYYHSCQHEAGSLLGDIEPITDMHEFVDRIREKEKAKAYCRKFSKDNGVPNLIGVSVGWAVVLEQTEDFANGGSTILIQGPPGVGKQEIANAIGQIRAGCLPLSKNLNEIRGELADGRLFGYKQGSHSKADTDTIGFFEAAGKRVLFLDEVDKASMETQGLLLRTIVEGTFEMVGDTESKKFEGSVVFATNRDLEELIEKNEFLDDLYGRVEESIINIPPLSIRPEDVEEIMLTELNNNKKVDAISMEAVELICNYFVFGERGKKKRSNNVRKLKSILNKICLKTDGNIEATDVPMEYVELSPAYQKECYRIPLNIGDPLCAKSQYSLGFSKEDINQLENMYVIEGKSISKLEVAKLFGTTYPTIDECLNKLNVNSGVSGMDEADISNTPETNRKSSTAGKAKKHLNKPKVDDGVSGQCQGDSSTDDDPMAESEALIGKIMGRSYEKAKGR
jgi:DNA-binding NtrC family response regulator